MGLRDEIGEQPDVVARLIGRTAEIEAIARAVRDREIEHVVIAARGTSDHAAIYAQYLFGIRMRLPVALAAPSIVSLYHVEPVFSRSLVIGISQSGASPDVVGVVDAARRQGRPTIAITNEPGSAAGDHRRARAGPGRRPRARHRGHQDVHRGAHGDRPARGGAGRRRQRPGGARGPAGRRGGGAGRRGRRPRGRAGTRGDAYLHGARARLRVRDRPRVVAEAQGARPRRRRPLLRRGLPPRPAGAGGARLPGPRRRDVGRRRRGPHGPAAGDPRGLRRGPGRRLGPRGRPRPGPALDRRPGRRPRPPRTDRLHRRRASCSRTT